MQAVRITADLNKTYRVGPLALPTQHRRGEVSAVIAARNDVLRVNEIAFRQDGRPMLTGSLSIPLDLRTPARPETLIPANGPLFADLVSSEQRFELVGTAPDTDTVIELARTLLPDVALLDVRMPGGGGPRAAREISAVSPATRLCGARERR